MEASLSPVHDPTRAAVRIREAVAATGLCRRTIHNRIADGTLRTVKLGGARLIERRSFERLLTPGGAV